ncbi:Roadblock/LC7 domain protein [Actinomadura rubteroloni]|uniref:Roadblock/LC7 domain protein n=1 Tax=Actinomadura rubteroloni TaxID=1926885 RepID=A0A2P4ULF5_9ACTN|nr:roadblock/LC7 domain-containing protein [Actinomadura rubteroloni]POM25882.1 Roadblock/LC7 domain protein [Actinomadura rubteroloni]
MTVARTDDVTWLLDDFVRGTDGVAEAVAVSSDGLLMARSAHTRADRESAEHLAAIVAGVTSLARGAAHRYDFEGLRLVMIEMNRGFLLMSVISDGSCLGVVASDGADLGLVGHQMALLCDRFGALLTPQLVSELKLQVLR